MSKPKKETYYWRALFRDGSRIDQYEYESYPPSERKSLGDLLGLTSKIELVPNVPGYPAFGCDVPIDAAPQFMLFWKPGPKGKVIDKDGSRRRDIVVAIGFSRNGISDMQGIELDSREVRRWTMKTPKEKPQRDFSEVLARV